MTEKELTNVLKGQRNLAEMGVLPEYINELQVGTIMVYDNHRIEMSTQDLYSVYGKLNEEIDEFGILEWDRMLAAEE